ncbi:rhodanese-like domain-containing protein [Exiguobacterium alkaliphilum]|uniref:rhodanese-like domain-containing protein n=1 Tax=Exiguobacterium alkaliphilum TaxID=1428684 RepID=UPI001BAC5BCE|nr:rhodanese-like domain-containing protein [Exiguobacterium alkaliphilum]QUE86932.1 rhodanese-like domain-containing protein [Exiguobacterium alkaliphilum]
MLDFLFVAVVIGLIYVWWSKRNSVKTVSTDELKLKIAEERNIQLLDVREPQEYRGGHIKQAKNVPLSGFGNANAQYPKQKDRPVYVICQSGMRSQRAAVMLQNAGYTDVYSVKGGMSFWRES